MKLKDIFEVESIDDKYFMICLDSSVFAGMVQLNETALFIVEALKDETTEIELAKKMTETYNVTEEDARRGISLIVEQLKGLGAIE